MGQIIAGIVLTLALIMITLVILKKRQGERPDLEDYGKVTMDTLLRTVKNEMAELTRESEIHATDDINYEAISRRKRRLEKALTESTFGIPSEVDIVTAVIKDIIQRELPTREDILNVIDFDNVLMLDSYVKWELLLVRLKPKHGLNTIKYLNDTYSLTALRIVDENECPRPTREFDFKLLDKICSIEIGMIKEEDGPDLVSYDEMTDVMANILFGRYHGIGCIGTLRAQNVDGINIGTSGSIRYEIEGRFDARYRVTNSIWVMINTHWVMFSFLDFFTIGEMKRVTNLITSWGAAPPMSEQKPYKVVDGYDGSRITAIRPPAGESWAVFIRKFTLSVHTVEWLLNKPVIHNWELPAQLIYFLMKGEQTTAFTGQQGTGKTTLIAAAMEFIEDKNIRCLEMSFELALRELYPEKNSFTVKPTEYVSAANLQDLLKKTDGWVSSVGEVAEDIVAARMIQFALIASAFTVFSHHGKDDHGLINGLTNSLVACGEYKDHGVASSTVLDVIRHNVHLDKVNGQRPIAYISQIVKENELTSYPEIEDLMKKAKVALNADKPNELAEIFMSYAMLTREYYTRRTDRVKFSSRYIIRFNKKTMTYEPDEWYTPDVEASIMNNLSPEDKRAFAEFYWENWGKRGK